MRLWHQSLIPYLPDNQLKGQHRECCALRGKGWNKKHSTIDYVFTYDMEYLVAYHHLIINELLNRNRNIAYEWLFPTYRGKKLGTDNRVDALFVDEILKKFGRHRIFKEHDELYYYECLENLLHKLRSKLNKYIEKYGTLNSHTLKVSQEVDALSNLLLKEQVYYG